MNSKTWTRIITLALIAAPAIPVQLAAQDKQDDPHRYHHYQLIDLGTFGGPASYLNNGYDGILNNHWVLAGAADTATPDPFPSFCFNFDCFVSHAFQSQQGVVTDLGTLAAGWSSYANWVSWNGLVAGFSQNGETDPLIGIPEFRAVFWKDGQIMNLGTLDGGYESFANAVNNQGQVVGFSLNTIPDPFSLQGPGFWPTQTRAFLWQNGVMQDLNTLGGPDASAQLVNERGQIAGNSYTNWTPNPVTGLPTADPFLWENGKMQDLGTLGGTFGSPSAMNQRGQVVGQSNLVGDLTYHPFLWNHGVMTDLGTLGGDTGLANWINDSGYIAGKADLAGSPPQNHHATLWKDEVVTDLGVFPGDSCSNAYFVNNKGQVVGTSEDRTDCSLSVGAHAFLWQQGGPMVNLNTLVPPDSPLNLTYAVAINDRGEIAGFGVPAACAVESYEYCGHAYVMIPCDENHPGMEGCDYRLVDASAGVEVSAVHAATLPTAAVNNNAPVGQQGQFRGRFAQPFPGFGVQQQK